MYTKFLQKAIQLTLFFPKRIGLRFASPSYLIQKCDAKIMEKQIRKEWKKKKGSILSLARDKKTMKIQDIRQSWWCRKWDPPHGLRQRGERCRTVYCILWISPKTWKGRFLVFMKVPELGATVLPAAKLRSFHTKSLHVQATPQSKHQVDSKAISSYVATHERNNHNFSASD